MFLDFVPGLGCNPEKDMTVLTIEPISVNEFSIPEIVDHSVSLADS
jgi:hypothetical protein